MLLQKKCMLMYSGDYVPSDMYLKTENDYDSNDLNDIINQQIHHVMDLYVLV